MANDKEFIVKNGLISQKKIEIREELTVGGTAGLNLTDANTSHSNTSWQVGVKPNNASYSGEFIIHDRVNSNRVFQIYPNDGVTANVEFVNSRVKVDGDFEVTGNVVMSSTFTANTNFADNARLSFGAASDLQIFSDGTKSYLIESGTGDLEVRATDFIVKNTDNSKIMASFNDGGAVSLRYDNAVKLATTNTGVDVTGTVVADGLTVSGNTNFADDAKALFGTNNDLEIFHSGDQSYIRELGAGNFYIDTNGAGVIIRTDVPTNNHVTFRADNAGWAGLYYQGAQKIATTSTGIDVTGNTSLDDGMGFISTGGATLVTGPGGSTWRARAGTLGGASFVVDDYYANNEVFKVGTDNNNYIVEVANDLTVGGDLTVTGDFTVSGNTTTIDTSNITVEDAVITLNSGQTTPLNDIGLLMQRYATANSTNYNVIVKWDESSDSFQVGSTVEDGTDNAISNSNSWIRVMPNQGTNGDDTYVGIGNIAVPEYKLHLHGESTYANVKIKFDSDTAVRNNYFGLDADADVMVWAIDEDNEGNNSAASIRVDGSAGLYLYGGNNAVNIPTAWSLGLGTTAPDRPFHVYHAATDFVAKFESGDGVAGIELVDSNSTYSPGIAAVGDDIRFKTGGQSSTDWSLTINGNDKRIDTPRAVIAEGPVLGRVLLEETWPNGLDGAAASGDSITGDLGEWLTDTFSGTTDRWDFVEFEQGPGSGPNWTKAGFYMRQESRITSPAMDLSKYRIYDADNVVDDSYPYLQTRVMATISYNANSFDSTTEIGYIQVSPNNGTDWYEVQAIFPDNAVGSTGWATTTIDLTPYANTNTKIRMYMTTTTSAGDYWYFGEIRIHESTVPLRLGNMQQYRSTTVFDTRTRDGLALPSVVIRNNAVNNGYTNALVLQSDYDRDIGMHWYSSNTNNSWVAYLDGNDDDALRFGSTTGISNTNVMATNGAGLALQRDGNNGFNIKSPKTELHIGNSGASTVLRLSDVDAANTSEVNAYIEFYQGENTQRAGWMGFGSALSDRFTINTSESSGDIRLQTVSGDFWLFEDGDASIGSSTNSNRLFVTKSQADMAAQEALVKFSVTGTATATKGAILHLETTRGEGTPDTDLFKVANSSRTLFNIQNDGKITSAQYIDTGTASATAALTVDNANTSAGAVIARFKAATDDLVIERFSGGDLAVLNTGQDNGIAMYDGQGGVEIWYNGTAVQEWDSAGGTNIKTGGLSIGGVEVINSSGVFTGTVTGSVTPDNLDFSVADWDAKQLTSSDNLDTVDGSSGRIYSWLTSTPTGAPWNSYGVVMQVHDGSQPTQLAFGNNTKGRLAVRRQDSNSYYDWTEFAPLDTPDFTTIASDSVKITNTDDNGNKNALLIESQYDRDIGMQIRNGVSGLYSKFWLDGAADDDLHISVGNATNGDITAMTIENDTNARVNFHGQRVVVDNDLRVGGYLEVNYAEGSSSGYIAIGNGTSGIGSGDATKFQIEKDHTSPYQARIYAGMGSTSHSDLVLMRGSDTIANDAYVEFSGSDLSSKFRGKIIANGTGTSIDAVATISTDSYVIAGAGSGGAALTHNDGYGNAQLTFNHVQGTPEQTGVCGRITMNTDSASNPQMAFQVGTGTAGTAVALNGVMYVETDMLKLADSTILAGADTSTYLSFGGSTGDFIVADNDLTVTNIIWYDKSQSELNLGTIGVGVTLRGHIDANGYDIDNVGKIRLVDANDLSPSSTDHAFQIGPSTGQNLRIDSNEIQVVNNGTAAELYLSTESGQVGIGNSATNNIAKLFTNSKRFDLSVDDNGNETGILFNVWTNLTSYPSFQVRDDDAYVVDNLYVGRIYNGAGTSLNYTGGESLIYAFAGSDDYAYHRGVSVADTTPVWQSRTNNTVTSEIEGDGSFHSAPNSYGGTSDVRLKENIIDTGSQWDDVKAMRIRKYSFIRDGLDAPNQLGVIAQELEEAGMSGLVTTKVLHDMDPETQRQVPRLDEDGNEVTEKGVKYSILYMKAVKALQEAMERIETLEAEKTAQQTTIDDILTRLSALENS